MFLFTIPHKLVFKNFSYFLGTANLRNNSLLDTTRFMACIILSQRIFVPNWVFVDVFLGRRFRKNSSSESFYKTEKDSLINEVG